MLINLGIRSNVSQRNQQVSEVAQIAAKLEACARCPNEVMLACHSSWSGAAFLLPCPACFKAWNSNAALLSLTWRALSRVRH